jgi:hypothetical protein
MHPATESNIMNRYENPFKPGEVLLVHFQEKPAFYIRIDQLAPDRKKGWWQVNFTALTLPSEHIVWLLDNDQIRGADFTMQGNPIRLERVPAKTPSTTAKTEKPPSSQHKSRGGGNVISLFDED